MRFLSFHLFIGGLAKKPRTQPFRPEFLVQTAATETSALRTDGVQKPHAPRSVPDGGSGPCAETPHLRCDLEAEERAGPGPGSASLPPRPAPRRGEPSKAAPPSAYG